MIPILSAFNAAPKQKDWPASIVHICKDDIPSRGKVRDERRHSIDYEFELKKAKMMTCQQLSDVLELPFWFVQSKLCALVKSGRATKTTLKRVVFFSHVDNENI
jgi:hypothetical protein